MTNTGTPSTWVATVSCRYVKPLLINSSQLGTHAGWTKHPYLACFMPPVMLVLLRPVVPASSRAPLPVRLGVMLFSVLPVALISFLLLLMLLLPVTRMPDAVRCQLPPAWAGSLLPGWLMFGGPVVGAAATWLGCC